MKLINDFCFLAFFILASTTLNVAYAENQPQKNQIELAGQMVRSDRVIVRLNNNRQTISDFSQQATLFSELGLKEVETIEFNTDVPSAARVANQDLAFTILSLDKSTDLKTVLKQLNDHPSVMYAEPDYILRKNIQPNDENFSQLWGLDNQGQEGGSIDADIDAPEAWDTSTDASSIIVGIIDSGVDYTHEDLAANMWINPGEIPDDGIDNDGNGYIDDIHGIDCVNSDSDPMDDESHGTHVAGILGAVGDNGIGVTGVSWNTKIMALKFLDNFGSGSVSDQLECLAYAVNMKTNFNIDVRITNNSYGGSFFDQAMNDAIEVSANVNMLFVASAGNFGADTDISGEYPSSFDIDNIISVAATTRTDNLAFFSNFGSTTVDLGAPGLDILSTIPGNQYEFFDGTSMAAPHVSGAAALLWANNPFLSALEIKYKLMYLGDPIADLRGRTVSGRRLNINSALNCLPGSPVLEILTPSDQFNLATGDVTLQAIVTDCGIPVTNIDVQALPGNGEASFALVDDGQGDDTDANDGIYTGIWQLQNPVEAISLTVSADSLGLTASVTGTVQKNYKLDSDHPFQWIDASSGTRLNISDSDDGAETVAIGFNFEFYGVLYSEIEVGANGFVKFDNHDDFSEFSNPPIPNNTEPNGFIAPYWDDLFPGLSDTANIYTLLEGTAPNRRLTIAWLTIPFYADTFDGNPVPDSPVTMEVTLYEGSNDIIFQYDGAYLADSATIGIEHQSGDFGLQYLFNGENNGEPVQISEEQAIRFYIEEDTPPGTTSLIPSDDANNRADLEGVLAVSKWEHAFFKFDASAVQQEVSKATLRVYYEAHRAPLTLFVGAVEDDNWTEEGDTPALTFIHNRPDLQLDSVEGTAPGYVEFDVTGFVADQVNGDGIVTLEVSSSHDNWDSISSKEGAFPPELVIEIQDTVAPSVPTGLRLDNVTGNSISFSWTPSTDDHGTVVLYHIMRDGIEIGTSSVASFTDNTVAENSTYVYNVTAQDDSGNESAISDDLIVNTSILIKTILTPSDDANNRADLDGVLAVSKWEHAFFRFDASAVQQEVSKASLRVYYEAHRAPLTLFVGAVEDDNWTEEGDTPALTYIHNRPDLQLDSVEGTAPGYVEFDVTEFVADQVNGDGIVTLEVSSSHDNWDDLSSKEGAFPPELIVETALDIDSELTAAYPFEEGSGQAIVDITGNGNNGTLEGDATRNPSGKNGEAIEFNGENSYIDLGTMDINSPNMAIALWFKADDFGIHDARFISKSTGTAESDHYWMVSTIRNGGQQKLRFRLKTENGGTSTLIGNAALSAGEWTHVTATYDGVEMKLYQDGVEVGSLTKSGAIATSASVETWIGANPGNTRYFDGLIDDVRIYGEAIGPATIEDIIQGNLPLNP